MRQSRVDVLVLGAGAAGLMCAIQAGKRSRSVVVLERSERAGKKIAISGGGRCNFTNVDCGPDRFLSANPDFCRSALARYRPADFIALVDHHRIRWHEKKDGQLFCDGSARQVVDLLLSECTAAGVDVRVGCEVRTVGKGARFIVETDHETLTCESLVVATGGLSIPKIGATDLGYRIARQFGIAIVSPKPGLVPLVVGGAEREAFAALAGVSFDSVIACDGARFRESTLFTHRGLSGPAILQISSYWDAGKPIVVDLLPDVDGRALLESMRASDMELSTLLSAHVPRRLAQTWTALHGGSRPIKRFSPRELVEIGRRLGSWTLVPAGTEGYGKAEVTCGGVDTTELSSKTMETRRVPGLYFVGEVVDVTGHLGGHNFQWAWASGFAAGQAA